MIFHDPTSLRLWIDVFFALAAASVAFAFVALTVGIRDLRRPGVAPATTTIGAAHGDVEPELTRCAA